MNVRSTLELRPLSGAAAGAPLTGHDEPAVMTGRNGSPWGTMENDDAIVKPARLDASSSIHLAARSGRWAYLIVPVHV